MKKTDIIASLSVNANISQQKTKEIVNIIIAELTKGIATGDGVEIRGFGSFNRKYRKSRISISPKIGNKIQIKERYMPFFRAAKQLKNIVNKA